MTATPGRLPRPQGSSSAVPRPRGLPGVSVLLLPDKAMDAGEDMPPVAEEPTLRRSDKKDDDELVIKDQKCRTRTSPRFHFSFAFRLATLLQGLALIILSEGSAVWHAEFSSLIFLRVAIFLNRWLN
ncbi:hypothetical protein OsJ_29447 [Oryza sativa Japonica Group]|nr:hypothetical protein OsJ_29447 [Oryza sativa Japonica Group]